MMAGFGSMSAEDGDRLKIAGASRFNVVISGGTGSGKTTMLNALSKMIDPGERVLTIEDAAELRLQQPHWLPLETRPANLEGQGEVSIRDLVKNACVCARIASSWAKSAAASVSTCSPP
jgi:pilus assembly protein CpaF